MVKNQHIVQRMLLSNFSIDTSVDLDERQIWVYDKDIKKSYKKNLRKVPVIENYLTEEADDIITILEKECIPAIDNILEKECIICNKFDEETIGFNNFSIYRYIGFQIARSKKFRERLKELPAWQKSSLEEIVNYQSSFFTHSNNPAPTLDFSMGIMRYDESKKWIEGSKYLLNMEYFPSQVPFKSFDGRCIVLMDVTYPLLVINDSDMPFITNDAGLNWYFPIDRYSFSLSTLEGILESILTFPLSPRLCVYLCTQKSVMKWIKKSPEGRGLMLLTKEQTAIQTTNDVIINHANRYVYSNSELSIKDKRNAQVLD